MDLRDPQATEEKRHRGAHREHGAQSWIASTLLALTLGILLPSTTTAQESPWGWWDDGDSIAHPVPDEESFLGTHGGARLALGSGTRGRAGTRRLDTRVATGPWAADLSGRCDSTCVGIRRRLSWTAPRFLVVAGDLPAWSGDPLLEEAGAVSARRSPLSRLGTGRSPAGVGARVDLRDLPPWGVQAHARLASAVEGGSRAALEGSVGVLRAGVALGDSAGSSPRPLGGLHLEGSNTAFEASHLGDPGSGAWRLALRSQGNSFRQEWTISRKEASASSGASGGEEASARLAWKRDGSRVDWEGLARDDTSSGRELLAAGSVSQEFAGVLWRLRGRWRGGDESSTAAFVPGVRRLQGRFRPWAEVSWSTRAQARPSGGIAWIDRGWRMEGSATRRATGAWEWSASSSLARDVSSLELKLSERGDELAGGGSWSIAW